MKKSLVVLSFALILIVSLGIASAGWFGNLFGKERVTGQAATSVVNYSSSNLTNISRLTGGAYSALCQDACSHIRLRKKQKYDCDADYIGTNPKNKKEDYFLVTCTAWLPESAGGAPFSETNKFGGNAVGKPYKSIYSYNSGSETGITQWVCISTLRYGRHCYLAPVTYKQ